MTVGRWSGTGVSRRCCVTIAAEPHWDAYVWSEPRPGTRVPGGYKRASFEVTSGSWSGGASSFDAALSLAGRAVRGGWGR